MDIRRYVYRHWRGVSYGFLFFYILLLLHTANLLPTGQITWTHNDIYSSSAEAARAGIYSSEWNLKHQPEEPDLKRSHQIMNLHKNIYTARKPRLPHEYMNTLFSTWEQKSKTSCGGCLVNYDDAFFYLENVHFIAKHASIRSRGGEEITHVLNQSEPNEMYSFSYGVFKIRCKHHAFTYRSKYTDHLYQWYWSLQMYNTLTPPLTDETTIVTKFTIALTRYEYANVYWTIVDIYNAFLMLKFFNSPPADTLILWVDAHSKGHLDDLWKQLFGYIHYLSEYSRPTTIFNSMVWSITRMRSPMLIKQDILPLVKEFRTFVLSRFGLTSTRRVQCGAPRVLFVWRRDYIAHPRNPKGIITRKVTNENEIIHVMKHTYPHWNITGELI